MIVPPEIKVGCECQMRFSLCNRNKYDPIANLELAYAPLSLLLIRIIGS